MLTEQEIGANKDRVIYLLRQTERKSIDDLIDWLCDSDFFIAPASSKIDRHGCHDGGLAQHSLNVYDILEMKAATYELGLRPDERTISALCHDMCKIGFYKKKVPDGKRKAKNEPKKLYDVENSFPFGHGEKSVLLVSKHIELTEQEALLIRWHMGPYDPAWDEMVDRNLARVCPAIYAFHHSDQEATKYMDSRVVKQPKGTL
ncbi:MAG: HD domain-containing protein [Nanoarchaeota archaeon]|nr:HD domain-containing protein [Nanoarchaeota archaeon]